MERLSVHHGAGLRKRRTCNAAATFAGSFDEDVVPSESFAVGFGGATYTCLVSTHRPPPGDGPTFLRVRNEFGSWRLDYEFADGAVQTLAI
jgi:hypothetical protein